MVLLTQSKPRTSRNSGAGGGSGKRGTKRKTSSSAVTPKRKRNDAKPSSTDEATARSFVGRQVEKMFPGHGLFHGKVASVKYTHGVFVYLVQYDDGDEEEMKQGALDKALTTEDGGPVLSAPKTTSLSSATSSWSEREAFPSRMGNVTAAVEKRGGAQRTNPFKRPTPRSVEVNDDDDDGDGDGENDDVKIDDDDGNEYDADAAAADDDEVVFTSSVITSSSISHPASPVSSLSSSTVAYTRTSAKRTPRSSNLRQSPAGKEKAAARAAADAAEAAERAAKAATAVRLGAALTLLVAYLLCAPAFRLFVACDSPDAPLVWPLRCRQQTAEERVAAITTAAAASGVVETIVDVDDAYSTTIRFDVQAPPPSAEEETASSSTIALVVEDYSSLVALATLLAALCLDLFGVRLVVADFVVAAVACPSQTALSAVLAGTFCLTVPCLPLLGYCSKLVAFTAVNAALNVWHEFALLRSSSSDRHNHHQRHHDGHDHGGDNHHHRLASSVSAATVAAASAGSKIEPSEALRAVVRAAAKSAVESGLAEGFGVAAMMFGGAGGELLLRAGVPIAYAKICYKALTYPQMH